MDFLFLFIALVVPRLLSGYLQVENLAEIVAKTVVFYFSYEVLMGELREGTPCLPRQARSLFLS